MGIRRIKIIFTVFFSLLFISLISSRWVSCQDHPQEQDLVKENPIPVYLASAVLPFDDLLLVDTTSELLFFNNSNKEDPQYVGNYILPYYIREHINVDDQLFSIGRRYNDTTTTNNYFAVYSIKENISLELIREYYLPYAYKEFIILENESSLVLTVNEDRQSLSLVNCTDKLVELTLNYTHETFFVNDEKITKAYYEEDYLVLEAYDADLENRTLAIFDISNRTQPELLLSWFTIVIDHTYYNGLEIEGNRFFLKTNSGYAKVLNITEDRSLVELGNLVTGYDYNFMRIIDNYAIISVSDSIYIFNITDWENVIELGSFERAENLGSLAVFFVIDDLIYVSHYATRTDNLLILLDWSDPANPIFIRTFGYPHTDNFSAFILAVPIVFLVFTFGSSKLRKEIKNL